MAKDLHIAVDFNDDLSRAGRYYKESDLDAMLDYSASLGGGQAHGMDRRHGLVAL